jgi:hypothetical protein
MSNLNEKPVTDFHIAQLDRNGTKLGEKVTANQWKVLTTDMTPEEIVALQKEQSDLMNAAGWLHNIRNHLRPPQIMTPPGSNGMKIVN